MLKMFPTLGKPGVPLEQQIESLTLPLMLRQKLLHSSDPSVDYGTMNSDEYQQDLKILLNKDPNSQDISKIFTNDLVPKLTAAEVAAVKKSATDFKIPGVTGTIAVPTIPQNAP
jgi:hypothetical protein